MRSQSAAESYAIVLRERLASRQGDRSFSASSKPTGNSGLEFKSMDMGPGISSQGSDQVSVRRRSRDGQTGATGPSASKTPQEGTRRRIQSRRDLAAFKNEYAEKKRRRELAREGSARRKPSQAAREANERADQRAASRPGNEDFSRWH